MRHNRKRIILLFLSLFLIPLFLAGAEEARDPFSPLIGKNGLILIAREIDITGMILQGVIYSQGESVAIINDEVVKTGDPVGEYKVLSIEEKKVILEKDNQEFILKLEE